jgi:hypothetical protein
MQMRLEQVSKQGILESKRGTVFDNIREALI